MSEIQANDVLEIKLRQLAKLEAEALKKEKGELEKKIAKITQILAKKKELTNMVIKEIEEDRASLGEDPRRTTIDVIEESAQAEKADVNSMIRLPEEKLSVAISEKFWIRGKVGVETNPQTFNFKTGDQVKKVVQTTTYQNLFGMDHTGRVYSMSAADIPTSRTGEGIPLSSIWDLQGKLVAVWTSDEGSKYLIASSSGNGFVANAKDLITRIKAGKSVLKLEESATPLEPIKVPNNPQQARVVAVSSDGSAVSFNLSELPEMPRGKGNGLMGLRADCKVQSLIITEQPFFFLHENQKTRKIENQDFEDLFGKRSASKKGKKITKTQDQNLFLSSDS